MQFVPRVNLIKIIGVNLQTLFISGALYVSETVKKFDYHAGHCDVSDPDKGQVEPLLLIQRGEGDHAPGRVKQDHGLVGD
jgi:hypothetical protein